MNQFKISKYPRGSEWRKWDMHIHTPLTKMNDQYSADTEEMAWDRFCDIIENSDVSVFGITDYFTVENYFKFIEKFHIRYPESEKVFFPNIEFRTDSKNTDNEHIQFHIIFSNEPKVLEKVTPFLARLELLSTDNSNGTNKYCSESDLASVGYDKAMVKIDKVKTGLKNDFASDEYLMVGVANGYGSLRPNGCFDGRGAEFAKELDKKCDIFFGKTKNTNFYLNIIPGREQYELPPKAILDGCDAHSFSDLENKLGKSFKIQNEDGSISDECEITWIKSDPTFLGFKEIVFEPGERVRLGELIPDEKEGYQIIDKVKFIDDAFSPEEIYLNQNLTTIIGGKSTGKSILLKNIAQSIDSVEVSKRLSEASITSYKYQVGDFRVFWKDGQENVKGENNGVSRKIIYIPQSYLNRLVDEKELDTSIDEIIKNVLEKEEIIKNVYLTLESSKRDTEKKITQNIENLFYKEKDIIHSVEQIKNIGDKKGISLEIEKLNKEISELKIKSGMTKIDLENYEQLINERNRLKNEMDTITSNRIAIVDIQDQSIFGRLSFSDLSEDYRKIISDDFDLIKTKYLTEWNQKLDILSEKLQKSSIETAKNIALNDLKLKPLSQKVIESKSLNGKIKKLEEEEGKLKLIIEHEKKYEIYKVEYADLIRNISETHKEFYENLFNAKTEILKQRSITQDQDLEFSIDIEFGNKSFQETWINDVCNQRNISQFNKIALQEYTFINNIEFNKDVYDLIKGIMSDELAIKKYSKKEAITKLTKCWFIFDYKIKQNGDEISEMSPGKKSFVLLKLLIELDGSSCPILLDQPEDDLDNRSIYNDLVKFIKTKKKSRQIIIATHNPNLVVGADSECVIVANQDGDKSKNINYKFEYVQGALENSLIIDSEERVLYKQGIQEHVCDVLEGGKIAFEQRKNKYNFN